MEKELFIQLLLEKNITLTDKQWNQFEMYYNELIEWNEKINLTAITEKKDVYIKHFYDSLAISFYVDLSDVNEIADIGSGAGFPSIPLKIIFPHLKITIIDSLNKRIGFLQHLTNALQLDDVYCVHSRAEDAARLKIYRDHFDLVTARAVARLPVLNELCIPFVKRGGLFISMKGSQVEEELQEAAYSFKELRTNVEQVFSFELPFKEAKRNLVVSKKIDVTPKKYPRNVGIPLKSPLVLN